MLVLSRRVTEQIRIGDSVVVTILRVKGNAVKVGIEAPPEVRIIRTELHDKLEAPGSERAPVAMRREPAPANPGRPSGLRGSQAPLGDALLRCRRLGGNRISGAILDLDDDRHELRPAESFRAPRRLGPAVLRELFAGG